DRQAQEENGDCGPHAFAPLRRVTIRKDESTGEIERMKSTASDHLTRNRTGCLYRFIAGSASARTRIKFNPETQRTKRRRREEQGSGTSLRVNGISSVVSRVVLNTSFDGGAWLGFPWNVSVVSCVTLVAPMVNVRVGSPTSE